MEARNLTSVFAERGDLVEVGPAFYFFLSSSLGAFLIKTHFDASLEVFVKRT